jgi:type III restriction enzyme
MELILQNQLEHQQKAIDAVCDVFENVPHKEINKYYVSPQFRYDSPIVYENIKAIQDRNELFPAYKKRTRQAGFLNLDVKMETGTGKTYVYTKTMFELHKRFGINKFIIIVHSLPVKAGAAQFLLNDNTKRHFRDVCGYDCEMEIGVLEAIKKKKGKQYFPGQVREFVEGSTQNKNKIYVLLLNLSLLMSNAKLLSNNYDFAVEGFYRPFNALKATHPFVIIDEPHRFERSQKAYNVILDEIAPQCIIRYGATYPEIINGKGKNKRKEKDYLNLLYDLGSCQAFNQNLIKGISKEHLEPFSGSKDEKVKITTTVKNEHIHLQLISENTTRSYTLGVGDPLSIVHPAFEGITVSSIDTSKVEFSNQIIKQRGESMDVDIFMSSYQEQMISLALKRHFEVERKNFERDFKIKTLALFFIDDRRSYREEIGSETVPYLKEMFERLLKERIEIELIDTIDSDYKTYLEASLADISKCHGGYFSNDNNSGEEAIAKQVKEILHDKMSLLSFKNANESYNTRRFIFSQWALKEGWDNPNVFTIAKLRSSGSENSKLQEVGRGLRLPVDEFGNRISQEEFTLNYIVDFTERDFAQQLVDEINGDLPTISVISKDKIRDVADKLGLEPEMLFANLLLKKYIDVDNNIIMGNRDAFFTEYPNFEIGLLNGKIKNRNKDKPRNVLIRPNKYAELKEFWEKINEKYLIFFEREINNEIEEVLYTILKNGALTGAGALYSNRNKIESDGTTMSVQDVSGYEFQFEKRISYAVFLKKIHNQTFIPIQTIHKILCKYTSECMPIREEEINEFSLARIVKEFKEWKYTNLQGRFNYTKANLQYNGTALSNKDGSPKKEIVQGIIGTKMKDGEPCDKYLYDTIAYDSSLEYHNIQTEVDSVVAYGKIPRKSIAIPIFDGSTYSPDFMYVVKKKDGSKEVNIVVETKDIATNSDLRSNELERISSAKKFFEQLSLNGYKVHFRKQLHTDSIGALIKEIVEV